MTAAAPTPAAASPRREARVLVVDDEENIRRLLRAILTRMPQQTCIVQEASSAEEGIETLDRQSFDLIITDYRMDGKTGVDLLAHAHDKRPETGRMLITAFGELDIGVEAINRGKVDGFLRKPWENARLIALVESLLAPRIAQPLGASVAAAAGIARAGSSSVPMSAADAERLAVEQEVAQLDKQLRQLRVRLGLGSISPEGYQLAAEELTRKKASLEIRLLKSA